MGFNCGIVGLPNVGKSTIFNALTSAKADSANYPFCTIEPNTGIVNIPDKRIIDLIKIVKPENVVKNTMEFVDIAGLVEGASKGEGLGNKFLSHIRMTDAIAHVVRCFDDDNVLHVSNRVDPISDIEIIELELLYADLDSCEKQIEKLKKKVKQDKSLQKELDVLLHYQEQFSNGIMGNQVKLSNEEKIIAKRFHFITNKAIMYVCNVSEAHFTDDNEHVKRVRDYVADKHPIVKICGKMEAEIAEIDDEDERELFLDELGIQESGLERMISVGHKLLNLKTYFTAGVKEVRAWTFLDGMTAPQTAGVIHSDFEKGFIKAEVISYDDFIKFNGESGAKEHGRLRLEGKDYIVQDGDLMHFRFNV